MRITGVLVLALAVMLVAGSIWTADAIAQGQAGSGKAPAGAVSKDEKTVQKDAAGKTGIATKEDAALVEKQKAAYAVDTCVVSGQKLGEHGDAVEYLHKGRLVRFCCAGCIASFEKDPAKYLAKLDEAAKDATGATVWTCTMHPEVREAKAGKCPKCGMNLVKAAANSKAQTPEKK